MPVSEESLRNTPIRFLKPGEIEVRNGPCSATSLRGDKIPLDGRYYCCSGKIILKNGIELRANFEINTHTFDFLERHTVQCFLDGLWYRIEEIELCQKLGIQKEDIIPYRWLPDVPLDYFKKGPYPMNWPD